MRKTLAGIVVLVIASTSVAQSGSKQASRSRKAPTAQEREEVRQTLSQFNHRASFFIGMSKRLSALLEDEETWMTIDPQHPKAVATGEAIHRMLPIHADASWSFGQYVVDNEDVLVKASLIDPTTSDNLSEATELTKKIDNQILRLQGMGFDIKPSEHKSFAENHSEDTVMNNLHSVPRDQNIPEECYNRPSSESMADCIKRVQTHK